MYLESWELVWTRTEIWLCLLPAGWVMFWLGVRVTHLCDSDEQGCLWVKWEHMCKWLTLSVWHTVLNRWCLFICQSINSRLSRFRGISYSRLLRVYTSESHTFLFHWEFFPNGLLRSLLFKWTKFHFFLDDPQTSLWMIMFYVYRVPLGPAGPSVKG